VNGTSTLASDAGYFINTALKAGWTLHSFYKLDKDLSQDKYVITAHYVVGVGDRAGYYSKDRTDTLEITVVRKEGGKTWSEVFWFKRPE
jgi:hypothetical protein